MLHAAHLIPPLLAMTAYALSHPSMNAMPSHLPPLGSWDAHVHVFDPVRFPYRPDRGYTPEPATLPSLLEASYAQNIMIVQASVEASPVGLAAHLADARREYPDRQFRGTIAADPDLNSAWALGNLSDEYFQTLHDVGVRCIRIAGFNSGGGSGGGNISESEQVEAVLGQLQTAASSHGVRRLGWSISAQLHLRTWAALAPSIDSILYGHSPAVTAAPPPRCADSDHQGRRQVVLIADHNGSATPADIDTPEFAQLLELLASRKLHVKIGALHRRVSPEGGGDVSAMRDIVMEIARVAPRGIVWGSDWPHVNATRRGLESGPPLKGVDTALELGLLRQWLTEEQWMAMMVLNPTTLFK
ncbi:D-galactarolactone isomerase [Microdochium nivale]|nr:D-galactarolactone isomerase [Microdochium nivale]